VIMLPFIFTKSMNALKSLSFLAVSSIVVFSIITIYNFVRIIAEGDYNTDDIYFFPSPGLEISEALASVPTCILAFTFQFNFFPVYKSLSSASDSRMKKTTFFALTMALTMYLVVAILGYMSFGSATSDQGLLKNFSVNNIGLPLYVIVLLTFSASSTLTFPLMFFGARENIYSFLLDFLVFFDGQTVARYREAEQRDTVSAKTRPQLGKFAYVVFCVMLYVFIVFLAIVTPSIKTVFDFVGSTAANAITYLLPSIFYLKLCCGGTWKKVGFGVFGYGVAVGIVCFVASIISLD